jgi:uroporphyrin-III C-methyltransferase
MPQRNFGAGVHVTILFANPASARGNSALSVTPGKVYIVGAGPGHPELLTVKAAKLLASCDTVVYDRLIQEEVLALAKPSAERIYMGKPVGRHESRQEEIHELLARKAREGKTVVRLKGGDPFLFGRGGEEAEFLAEREIPFEVVPGVSAALAAPLSAGIAITHRDTASAVAIVTGHEAAREESRLDWDALAAIDTLVFLMGVHNLHRITAQLIAHGRAADTPAAVIQMAYWHGENVLAATLADIAEKAAEAGISPPSTLVVGQAVRLREKLKHSQRDLSRRPDTGARFAPAPAPDALLRLATGGMASQVFRFALATSLFDRLEEWCTAPELARSAGLNRHGLAEILECLVSLGLLECGPPGYRNLELASRYLREASPESLRPALLYQAAQVPSLGAVGRYAMNGRQAGGGADLPLRAEAFECLARHAAPVVMDKLGVTLTGAALFFGWGGVRYRDLARQRWPELAFAVHNPFAAGDGAGGTFVAAGTQFDAVFLSSLLPCCDRKQYLPWLERAASVLRPGGLLVLHDSFAPGRGSAAPELTLATLGRHAMRGGSRAWTVVRLKDELDRLGLRTLRNEAVSGGSHLVVAARL